MTFLLYYSMSSYHMQKWICYNMDMIGDDLWKWTFSPLILSFAHLLILLLPLHSVSCPIFWLISSNYTMIDQSPSIYNISMLRKKWGMGNQMYFLCLNSPEWQNLMCSIFCGTLYSADTVIVLMLGNPFPRQLPLSQISCVKLLVRWYYDGIVASINYVFLCPHIFLILRNFDTIQYYILLRSKK